MQKLFSTWLQTAIMIAMVTLLGASISFAQVAATVGDVTGRPGETASVAVTLSGVEGGAAVQSFGFTVAASAAGITFTGVSTTGTSAGDAGFTVATNTTNGSVGGFSTGTDITASGTVVFLNFSLDSASSGTVTLSDFTVNGAALAGGDPTSGFAVSDRIIAVASASVGVGSNFMIVIDLEDALVDADGVVSFSADLNYDPSLMSIDKTVGSNGVVSDGTLTAGGTVNGNDIDSDTYRIAGFVGSAITGSGTFVLVAATAASTAGSSTYFLSNVVFNAGIPVYASRSGTLTVTLNTDTEPEGSLPTEFTLQGNYPNPFNPTTTIQFDLPETANVTVQILDLLGREVLSVPSQTVDAGSGRSIQINASSLASGIYLYRVIAQGATTTSIQVKTMTLLK